ncbi:MAG: DASS family sodium-coupled anion symporter [Bacteroidota bacterium]|nr:DASS family sodium-coupled anion symporter [Bacteroidota bacterium]
MRKNLLSQRHIKQLGLFSGIAGFLLTLFFSNISPDKPEITATLATGILMAVWWITEAIPISVTALLPVVLFPFLGIMDGKAVSSVYFNHIIFLFLGGFLMAGAMEKHGLHKRIALRILLITGSGFGQILFGFMFATAFLSAWMSNTATAMMMIPVVLSVIIKLNDFLPPRDVKKVTYSLLLGIAYSASAGGISTLIGTPPNLSFARIFNIIFPAAPEISFSSWVLFALPISIIMIIAVWLVLYLKYKPAVKTIEGSTTLFREELQKLGPINFEEKVVGITFSTLALMWISRSGFTTDSFSIPGWSAWLNHPELINDGTVAILAALLLFIIPSKNKPGNLLDAKAITSLPWNIVLLFGGGFALAQGFTESGLAVWLGDQMKFISDFPLFIVVLIVALFMSFLTELTSNTASTEMFLPILAGIGISTGINPLIFMLPATVAASLAFMLPVATPPNAVVFGTKKLEIREMVRTGVLLNFIGVIIVALAVYFWAPHIFNINFTEMPAWAVSQ